MNNTVVLLVVLIVVLIYFLSQMPRKTKVIHRHPYRRDVVYVNNSYPIWRMPTGWARPIRRKIRHIPMMPVFPAHHLLGPGGIHRFN